MKKRRFNIIYNNNKKLGMGEGYYIVFENYEGEPMLDSVYKTIEYSEQVDMVSVGILNKINHLYDMGWVLDKYYTPELEKLL